MPATFDDSVVEKLTQLVPVTVSRSTKRLEQALRNEVPIDEANLRDDVTHELTKAGRVGQVGFSSARSFYWRFVNDGTAHQPGQHFVENTVEANRGVLAEEATKAARELFGD